MVSKTNMEVPSSAICGLLFKTILPTPFLPDAEDRKFAAGFHQQVSRRKESELLGNDESSEVLHPGEEDGKV